MAPRSKHAVESGTSAAKVVASRLDNGVWILSLPTPEPGPGYRGVASIQLWISAGAASERAREHGCAHLLEHMAFKPWTDAAGQRRDLAGVVEQLGGDVNAFTSHDETVFHATIPADTFAEVVETMIVAVIGRRFDPEILAREQEVVVEEIRQYADDPAARSVQLLMSDLYGDHGYARPVLGEEAEVRALTSGRLQAWGRRQHRGERVVLVVAGPIPSAEVEAAGRRLLAELPEGRRARTQRPQPPSEPRVRVERADVQEAYLRLGWLGGVALSPDGVALDVAAVALGQGESSRLALGARRRARLVSDVYASYLAGFDSGTFVISAQAEAEAVEAAAKLVLDEVEALARAPIDAEELARARALLQSSLVYRRETVQGQAHALGYFATASGKPGATASGKPGATASGELGAEDAYFEVLAGLSAAEIRDACARHLQRGRAVITVLLPRDQIDARGARAMAKRLTRTCVGGGGARSQGRSRRAGAWVVARAKTRDFGLRHATHRSGLRVVARADRSVPVVAGWLVWPGGLRLESAREAGISSLTAALLNRGTSHRDGDALAREIEGLAAVLDGFSGHNSVGIQTESLAEHLPTVLARAIECGLEPRFDPEELDEARRIALADLDADADDPGHLAYRTMLRALYGKHPSGRDLRGSRTSLGRMSSARLAKSWARDYPIERAVLSLAGDFDLDTVLVHLDEALAEAQEKGSGVVGGAQAAAARARARAAAEIEWPGGAPRWPTRPVERVLTRDREQGQCVIGFPGLRLGAPEGAALDVLCSVLGGQAGRLFESLREREGLVYQVGASSSEHIDGGHVVFYAAASQDKLDAARAAVEAEIAGICADGVSPAELDRAQRWLVGQFESGLQRRSRVASRMVFGEVYGLGAAYYLRYPERIAAVTPKQILELARRLLDPRRQVTVLVRA